MTVTTYGKDYHLYPVYTSSNGFESAIKRFMPFPTPQDVYDKALLGLPKFFPLTGEAITVDMVENYLTTAITEIEMSLNMDLTPTDHYQSFDYIDGMLTSNYTGLKLERWPAFKVNSMQLKFPHTQMTPAYQTFTIPSGWIALRRNKLNVLAAWGSVSIQTDNSQFISTAGVMSYITGFARGWYQPAAIEVVYTSGFENDKLPASVWDLVVTLASLRFLEDIAAPLFPHSGVSVSVDSISQSASMPGPALLLQKIESLKEQYPKKVNAITRNFGRTLKMAFIGA